MLGNGSGLEALFRLLRVDSQPFELDQQLATQRSPFTERYMLRRGSLDVGVERSFGINRNAS